MKVLISVDIEGVAGIVHPEQTVPGNAEYERGRRLMTAEANAVVEGAIEAGATRIIVNDSHGHYRNLLPELLHPAASLIQGKPRLHGMMAGIGSDVDAVMMVGYHAAAFSRGTLAHTMNGFAFGRIWLDGHDAGEATLYGAVAAEFGVPVVLASGDDVLLEEARELFPNAQLVGVKQASGCLSGVSYSPQQSCAMLRTAAARSLGKEALVPPAQISVPIVCRLQARSTALADLFEQMPILERTDPLTVEFSAPSAVYVVRVLNCLSAMAKVLQ